MTDEMRNLSSGKISFLVKDKLFVGRKMSCQTLPTLKYQVCASNITLILTEVRSVLEIPCCHCHSPIFFWFTGKILIADQFLDRLPKVVVKAGQVINIRESLRATLRVSGHKIPPHSKSSCTQQLVQHVLLQMIIIVCCLVCLWLCFILHLLSNKHFL